MPDSIAGAPRPDDDPQDNTPARGLPLRELHSGPQPASEFPQRAPEFDPAAAETGEPGDPDEFTVEHGAGPRGADGSAAAARPLFHCGSPTRSGRRSVHRGPRRRLPAGQRGLSRV